jgi:inhibitor of cysteine peptidase
MFNLIQQNLVLMIFLCFIVISCSSATSSLSDKQNNLVSINQEDKGTTTYAFIDEIKLLSVESFPIQVNIIAKGYFEDDCTTIGQIIENQSGNTLILNMITAREINKVCKQDIKPFEKIIPLNVAGLSADIYTVTVNNKSAIFELVVDNIMR